MVNVLITFGWSLSAQIAIVCKVTKIFYIDSYSAERIYLQEMDNGNKEATVWTNEARKGANRRS